MAVNVTYFGPLPDTPRGNAYILLFTGRFSRRADMFAVSAAECTAAGTADILVKTYMPLWGCPASGLLDSWLQSYSNLSVVVYKLLGLRKLARSAYHPNGHGGVKRVNYTMASMRTLVVNERQDDWDIHLPQVEFTYNNSSAPPLGLPQMRCT